MTNDGILTIYDLENTADAGEMPQQALVEVCTAYYSFKKIGVTRLYAAVSANRKIDAVVRCYFTNIPLDGKYVILEDGNQYRIDLVQEAIENDAVDLTLIRIGEKYDVLE